MPRILRMIAALVLLAGLLQTGPVQGQEASAGDAGRVKFVEQFIGKARLGGPLAQEVSIAIYRWSVGRRQKIAVLELPVKGTLIVQLRAGVVVTTINGKRQKRRADEFWTVPAGVTMGIETGNDTVILQTVVVSE